MGMIVVFLITLLFLAVCQSISQTTDNVKDPGYQYCDRKVEGVDACQKPENTDKTPHLSRIHPNKVGEEVEIEIEGRLLKRITRAIHPPIFEIPHYLTDTECAALISIAKKIGLTRSLTILDSDSVGKQTGTSMMNQSDVYRVSENTGIPESDPINKPLRERLLNLTGLSREIIFASEQEQMQVINYTPGGHYHTHLDSEKADPARPCCQLVPQIPNKLRSSYCRLCRYISVIYYLNDVDEGGETAFPWALFEHYDKITTYKNNTSTRLNLSENCHSSNLVVKPKRGTAVFWYPHLMDNKGCVGALDRASLHGGCDVIKGEKWIMTSWIDAPIETKGKPSNCPQTVSVGGVGSRTCEIGVFGFGGCSNKEDGHELPHLDKNQPNQRTKDGVSEPERLTIVHPKEVGETVNIKIGGRILQRITRAIKPPVFEIPDFLSAGECEFIIRTALEHGLQRSGLYTENDQLDADIKAGKDPKFLDRISDQTFLPHDKPELVSLREKLIELTGLPRRVIFGSEKLQVVYYKPGGHYHAHYDSIDKEPTSHGVYHSNLPCCHLTHCDDSIQAKCCRICRLATILYYLNDVEEGGETAFPLAVFKPDEPVQTRKREEMNLSYYCHASNMVVKPKRGTAILWYSHHVDERGCMSTVDPASLHGGCDVIKGEKWIANSWINAPIEDPDNPSGCT